MTDATGPVATLDFPHGYHDCLHRHGMAPKGPDERKCDNCFCVVCNMPHTSCKRWSDHWKIRQGSQEARDARQAAADAERPFVDKSTVRLTDLKQLVTPLSATRVGKFHLTLAQRTAAAWMDGILNGRAGAVPSTLITRTKERASEVPSQPVRGGILALDCGIGKTALALWLVSKLGHGEQALIVAPSVTHKQWETALKDGVPDKRVLMTYGRHVQNRTDIANQHPVVTCEVALVDDRNESFAKAMSDPLVRAATNYKLAIVDESHQIFSHVAGGAGRGWSTKLAMHFATTIPERWCISGTPFDELDSPDSPDSPASRLALVQLAYVCGVQHGVGCTKDYSIKSRIRLEDVQKAVLRMQREKLRCRAS